jgi:hypothetical protein
MRTPTQSGPSIHAAALGAAALIAHQVGGKAIRDTLFLSYFDVASLAWMVVLASVLSIIVGVAAARLISSASAARIVPRAFLASALLFLAEWALSAYSHRVVAVLVYLQIAALGSVLISGFWSLLGDRFDPHSARKQFGRVVASGTFGGMVGGLLAERIGSVLGVTSMLPVLAALHLICGFLTSGTNSTTGFPQSNIRSGAVRDLRKETYLRHLALLILLTTAGAGLLDYVFKARAVAEYQGSADLVRFFAIFYAAVGVITFFIQVALSRISLERLGLAGTVGSLPFAVALGSLSGILIPGVWSASLARGGEAVLRSSLFRSGYELFYAAVPHRVRQATKPILDVGFERVGDMIGGVLISVILLAGAGSAIPLMLTVAGLMGLAGLWISQKLHQGYVKALESNLLNQSIHIDISDIRDSTTRAAVMRTLGNIMPSAEPKARAIPVMEKQKTPDPFVQRVLDLRSSNAAIARKGLREPIDAVLAPHAIAMLAWDAVADDAVLALQRVAPSITGQLVDALLDPEQEFAVRRRIPRVLSICASQRAFDGLMQALFDKRFEVRFQAGRALAQMQDRSPGTEVNRAMILSAVISELRVDQEVWHSRSVIDAGEAEVSSVSLEHVFRLLSLILPRDPLKNAYRGLHSDDERLRGTALEYLDTVLPSEVRKEIWPVLYAA